MIKTESFILLIESLVVKQGLVFIISINLRFPLSFMYFHRILKLKVSFQNNYRIYGNIVYYEPCNT